MPCIQYDTCNSPVHEEKISLSNSNNLAYVFYSALYFGWWVSEFLTFTVNKQREKQKGTSSAEARKKSAIITDASELF